MKLDLNLLRVFIAIFEAGSVSRAAARLDISQPAASAALARLRAVFSDALFVRIDSRMQPTPLAESMAIKVRHVLDVVDTGILTLPSFEPFTYSGEFVFSLSEIGEVVFLPDLYQRLRVVAPQVGLRSIAVAPERLQRALHDGEVDLAVGYFPDLVSQDIFQQRLFSHVLACLVRKDHPLQGPGITRAQFEHAQHLAVRDGSRSLEMYEHYIASQGWKRQVAVQMSHYMSVPSMIENSNLLAIMPRTIAEHFAKTKQVKVLAPPRHFPKYDLKQYWHRRFHNDSKSRWLRAQVVDIFDGYM